MPTRDELQRLSDAAQQGTWASKNANVLAADGRAVVVACDWDDLAEWQANVALIVALVNGWRDGSIVAAEPGVAVPEPDEQRRPEWEYGLLTEFGWLPGTRGAYYNMHRRRVWHGPAEWVHDGTPAEPLQATMHDGSTPVTIRPVAAGVGENQEAPGTAGYMESRTGETPHPSQGG